MNLSSKSWDASVCKYLDIPTSILPTIKSSAEVYGTVKSGPLKNVKLSGCIGDQQGALLGQLCVAAGNAKNTYGTGCFMLMNTGTQIVQSKKGLLTTVSFQLGASAPVQYALEGSVASAGSAVTWLVENLQVAESPKQVSDLAASVPDNGGVYLVPAFSGLLSPYWREDARCVYSYIHVYVYVYVYLYVYVPDMMSYAHIFSSCCAAAELSVECVNVYCKICVVILSM
jgi:glycerol kinase